VRPRARAGCRKNLRKGGHLPRRPLPVVELPILLVEEPLPIGKLSIPVVSEPLPIVEPADFMCYFNSNLAKEIARRTGWKDKVWGRRYQAIVISDEEEVLYYPSPSVLLQTTSVAVPFPAA
jgi:hypothetical protein